VTKGYDINSRCLAAGLACGRSAWFHRTLETRRIHARGNKASASRNIATRLRGMGNIRRRAHENNPPQLPIPSACARDRRPLRRTLEHMLKTNKGMPEGTDGGEYYPPAPAMRSGRTQASRMASSFFIIKKTVFAVTGSRLGAAPMKTIENWYVYPASAGSIAERIGIHEMK